MTLRRRITRFTATLATALAALPGLAPQADAQEVELELALLIDTSGSVDSREFALQLGGYVDAFRDPQVQATIIARDGVAVSVMQWSAAHQQSALDWFIIETANDCLRMADKIEGFSRQFANDTIMAPAIERALNDMYSNTITSARQVIDVSGDGIGENEAFYRSAGPNPTIDPRYGTPWQTVMAMRQPTTTINGIYINNASQPNLSDWYSNVLPQGVGHFAIGVSSFDTFGAGIKQKLIREISDPAPRISYD